MYTITFLTVRAFQLSKRHISTIHNLKLCAPSHSSKYELFNCQNVISQQSTIQSYVHHCIPHSTSFSIVQTSYLNNPQFRVMYSIAFLKVRAFQLSKRHISTIHNLELCTPSHSSKYELFNCPNVISQQSTIQSYVHHHIPQSTSFSIVQTSYLNNPQFRVMYTIALPQSTSFSIVQTSYLYLQNYPNGGTECLYYAMYLIQCVNLNISLVRNKDLSHMMLIKLMREQMIQQNIPA